MIESILDIRQPRLPDTIQLERMATADDLRALAEEHPDAVTLETTRGRGKHHGRHFLRASINAPVTLDERVFNRARCGPVPVGKGAAVVKGGTVHAQQTARDLWLEVRSTYHYGDHHARDLADVALKRLLESGYRGDDAHLLRVWLHFYGVIDAARKGRNVARAVRIYNGRLGETAARLFGIESWEHLADAVS